MIAQIEQEAQGRSTPLMLLPRTGHQDGCQYLGAPGGEIVRTGRAAAHSQPHLGASTSHWNFHNRILLPRRLARRFGVERDLRPAVSCLIVLVAIAGLVGCSSAAPQKEKPSADAGQFVTVRPWEDGSVDSAIAVKGAGSCSASEIAPRRDGYRCFVNHGIFDPCFQDPADSSSFLCSTANDDFVKLSGVSADSSQRNVPDPGQSPAFKVVLVDGTVCTRSTGAGPVGAPGFPYWLGHCSGPSGGIWRNGGPGEGSGAYQGLYPSGSGDGWQLAVSEGAEAAVPTLVTVRTAYR